MTKAVLLGSSQRIGLIRTLHRLPPRQGALSQRGLRRSTSRPRASWPRTGRRSRLRRDGATRQLHRPHGFPRSDRRVV